MRYRSALGWFLVVASMPRVAAAADCSGGSLRHLTLIGDDVHFSGTVTRRGVTHANFVAAPLGFRLQILLADDGAVVHQVIIPPERFVTRSRTTKYDGAGAFRGRVVIRNARHQADTVSIVVHELGAGTAGLLGTTSATRVGIDTGEGCARTCVSACSCTRGGWCALRARPTSPSPSRASAPSRARRRTPPPGAGWT